MARLPEYSSFEEKTKVFAKYQRIDNVADFETWYNGLPKKDVFFRGMKEAKFKNFTSAQREYIKNDFKGLPSTYVYLQIKHLKKVYNNLLTNYCKSVGIALTDFYLMSFAQHHSPPGISLLLDITPDINTALYFMSANGINEDIGTNNINEYASIYIFQRPSVSFGDITKEISSKTRFRDRELSAERFHKLCERKTQKFCKLTTSSFLLQKNYFLVENHLYHILYKYKDYIHQDRIMVTNLNLVAQNGCFLYYNYENLLPLEKEVEECVDINKSLIPYITKKYLIPNHKTTEELFPEENRMVEIASIEMHNDPAIAENNFIIEFNMPTPSGFVV